MSSTSEIWHEFSAPLREFIRRRVRDEHLVDDLLQDVFVRVHQKLDSLVDDDRLTAWLYRITRNVISDHHRRRAPSDLADMEIAEDQQRQGDVEFNREVGKCIGRFIAGLPVEYREAVELEELHELPQQAIADRIGLSLSGTKSRIQRGRKMLKAMLLECCRFEFDRSGNVIDYDLRAKRDERCADDESPGACDNCDG